MKIKLRDLKKLVRENANGNKPVLKLKLGDLKRLVRESVSKSLAEEFDSVNPMGEPQPTPPPMTAVQCSKCGKQHDPMEDCSMTEDTGTELVSNANPNPQMNANAGNCEYCRLPKARCMCFGVEQGMSETHGILCPDCGEDMESCGCKTVATNEAEGSARTDATCAECGDDMEHCICGKRNKATANEAGEVDGVETSKKSQREEFMSRMKSMTFGQMPPREEFVARVQGEFPMQLKGTDAVVADLAQGGEGNTTGFSMQLDGEDLYEFVEQLLNVANEEGIDPSYSEAADSVASSIMLALGYEWV